MENCKIALIGNPNVGKSSIFNLLSGLHQKTGNYPGVTVEISKGFFTHEAVKYELIDFPGTYSIYPSSTDEEIVFSTLTDESHPDFPDKIIVIVDPLNLKRSLLLYLQIKDLGFPTLLIFNFLDTLQKKGIEFNEDLLKEKLETSIIFTNARAQNSASAIKKAIAELQPIKNTQFFEIPIEYQKIVEELQAKCPEVPTYKLWLSLAQKKEELIPKHLKNKVLPYHKEYKVVPKRLQVSETIRRYAFIEENLPFLFKANSKRNDNSIDTKADKIVTHPFFGYVIFFGVLYGIFQSMFFLSQFPMEWIEGLFSNLSALTKTYIPDGPLQSLLADGIIPGIGGIVVFVPLIAILFTILIFLEEIGYMSRVVFLMDRWLKPFGLSGKSVVPLISGVACAIPAILSARNIENAKERLITILVTPFITCSARLPVYAIIVAIVIPKSTIGIFDYRGLAMMLLYFLGFAMALLSAFVLKKVIKSEYKSYLVLDMPSYKVPILKNIVFGVWKKTLDFIFGAGKIILAFSIILWVLGTFGPSTKIDKSLQYNKIALEDSFLGKFGKTIEPAIKPLGYDWKIGIGLLSSFAAREVFVSSMATIYSIDGESENADLKLTEKLKKEVNPHTLQPVYNVATGFSLLMFYAFAMQCISTIAIVKKETNSWKYALLQMVFMTGIAYVSALITYQVLK